MNKTLIAITLALATLSTAHADIERCGPRSCSRYDLAHDQLAELRRLEAEADSRNRLAEEQRQWERSSDAAERRYYEREQREQREQQQQQRPINCGTRILC